MFKSLFKGTKRLTLWFFNFPKWLNWEAIKGQTDMLVCYAKNTFTIQSKAASETFEEAVERLGLTEERLQSQARAFFRLSIFCVAIGAVILSYSFYLIFSGLFLSSLLGLALTGLCLALAFRYHFWYFQITRRKLGTTFTEWWQFFSSLFKR